MRSSEQTASVRHTRADVSAGIVVALVALPLCLGIALASGAPLISGLITGVIGGLLVSRIGGAPLLVSGPAAGLAAIVLAALAELGSFEALLAALVVAGLGQLALGALRGGRFAALVPSSVVTGMLAAIGILLILQQLPHALGVAPGAGAHGLALLGAPLEAIPRALPGPTLLAGLALGILILWERPALRRLRGVLPGPLAAVIAATALAAALPVVAPAWSLAASSFVDLPDLGGSLASAFTFPDFSALAHSATWRVAFTIAVVASIETLLSLEATDRMDPLRRTSDPNRELLAQGVGNTLAGLIGGLPMTGVIVRSTVAVEAGGRTSMVAFVHGVVVAAAVVIFPGLLELVPLAALAAVLIHTGWKLAHPARLAAAARVGWGHAVPLAVTILGVVATDLLIGVILGLLAGALASLATTARHGLQVDRGEDTVRLVLADAVSFVHKPRIRDALHEAPDGSEVVVDGSRTRVFDHDVVELLHGWSDTARRRNIRYQLVGVPEPHAASTH